MNSTPDTVATVATVGNDYGVTDRLLDSIIAGAMTIACLATFAQLCYRVGWIERGGGNA